MALVPCILAAMPSNNLKSQGQLALPSNCPNSRPGTMRVIVVYRPPSSDFRSFLDDVGKVLLTAATHPTETVVCGDFNTRYGDPTCTNATNLADLLETSGFVQHVDSPTHERGNILDLVITSSTSHIIATPVKPTTLITDHSTVECELHQPKPKCLKRHVQYRKFAAIDNGRFAADLEASDFHAPEQNPTALLARYDSCIRSIVDDHAPIVSRTITVRPMTPWYNSELSAEKRDMRRAERAWRQSGLTVHRQTGRRNNFRTSLKKARSGHYLSEIQKAGGNMRSIYKISNALLGRDVDKPLLPEGSDTTHAGPCYQIPAEFHRKGRCAML